MAVAARRSLPGSSPLALDRRRRPQTDVRCLAHTAIEILLSMAGLGLGQSSIRFCVTTSPAGRYSSNGAHGSTMELQQIWPLLWEFQVALLSTLSSYQGCSNVDRRGFYCLPCLLLLPAGSRPVHGCLPALCVFQYALVSKLSRMKQCNAAPCCVMPCNPVRCCRFMLPCCTMLCDAYRAILCCAVLRRAMCAVPCQVDLGLWGHDHNYERTHPMREGFTTPHPGGTVHIVAGTGGRHSNQHYGSSLALVRSCLS